MLHFFLDCSSSSILTHAQRTNQKLITPVSITWAKSVVLDQCRIHMDHSFLATTVVRASECANKS
jgi:hypothetical protein